MAFTDGMPKSLAFDFKGNVRRNSPSLINAIYSTAYFWDGRTEYLQDQVTDVLNKVDELHGTYEEVVHKLKMSKEYKELFKNAFKDQPEKDININKINRAIAAYIQGLVALNSPFDRYIRKESEDLNIEAIRGFNLFMGKASCGTCHFAPIFNGTVPPRFMESETEVLGVPASADLSNTVIDSDSGRAEFIKARELLHSFKTVTVRNANLTAPYMHNGVFETLEELIDFYDLGGGQGIGLEVPNQTLPPDQLNLCEQEKKDLKAFMISLTDTTATTSIPTKLPSYSKNSELNKRIVGGKY
jgi:cytochrome c peroxidase